MGVEYYIIAEDKKQIFHLGKEVWYNIEGMSTSHHARLCEYNDWEEVLHDIISAGCYCGLDTMDYLTTLASHIFNFVYGAGNVRVGNDYEEDADWLNWEEVESIHDICREIYGG